MWLLWAVPAAIILLFSGIVGTRTTKRWAKKGRKKLYRWTKKRTTQRWAKRKAARQRISTATMVRRRAQNDRIAGRAPKSKSNKPRSHASILKGGVCGKRTRDGSPCRNNKAHGESGCYLHKTVSVL
jgi:hypothetical protein